MKLTLYDYPVIIVIIIDLIYVEKNRCTECGMMQESKN